MIFRFRFFNPLLVLTMSFCLVNASYATEGVIQVQASCIDMQNYGKHTSFNYYAPKVVALMKAGYEIESEHNEYAASTQDMLDRADLQILVAPKHGRFVPAENPNVHHFLVFQSDDGFVGQDAVVFAVTLESVTVNLAVNINIQDIIHEPKCDESGHCEEVDPPCWGFFPNDPRSN